MFLTKIPLKLFLIIKEKFHRRVGYFFSVFSIEAKSLPETRSIKHA